MTAHLIDKFREGLEELLYVSAEYGSFARAMGTPVFDASQNTAYVAFERSENTVVFAFNPDFLESLSTEETAAVILHETHHVLLDHLKEMADDTTYPQKHALTQAQECIINDTIAHVFSMTLPEGVMRGTDLLGESVAQHPTLPVYTRLINADEDDDSDSPSTGGSTEGAGDVSQDSTAGGTGDDSQDHASTADTGDGEHTGDDDDTESSEPAHDGFSCGSVAVSDKDKKAYRNSVSDALSEAARKTDKSVDELLEDMDIALNPSVNTADEAQDAVSSGTADNADNARNESSGGYGIGGPGGTTVSAGEEAQMNWKDLLAQINPKVLSAGRKRRRMRYNWTKTNRRMSSVYPDVVLPVVERVDPDESSKGDQLPALIIALDLSGSIPRSLVGKMQGLVDHIPQHLIRAYPCTWSNNLVPYDPEVRAVCSSRGTDPRGVVEYAKTVKQETGKDPYVLMITDGKFSGIMISEANLDKWFYMAILDSDVRTCTRHARGEDKVYRLSDFSNIV